MLATSIVSEAHMPHDTSECRGASFIQTNIMRKIHSSIRSFKNCRWVHFGAKHTDSQPIKQVYLLVLLTIFNYNMNLIFLTSGSPDGDPGLLLNATLKSRFLHKLFPT